MKGARAVISDAATGVAVRFLNAEGREKVNEGSNENNSTNNNVTLCAMEPVNKWAAIVDEVGYTSPVQEKNIAEVLSKVYKNAKRNESEWVKRKADQSGCDTKSEQISRPV